MVVSLKTFHFVLYIYHQISILSLKKLLLMQSLSNYWQKQIREHSFFYVLTWSLWSGISDLCEKHKPEAVMQLWSFTNNIPLFSDEKHNLSYTWLAFTTSNLLSSSSLKGGILDTISKKQCFVGTSVFFCIFMNLTDMMPQDWNTEIFFLNKSKQQLVMLD